MFHRSRRGVEVHFTPGDHAYEFPNGVVVVLTDTTTTYHYGPRDYVSSDQGWDRETGSFYTNCLGGKRVYP